MNKKFLAEGVETAPLPVNIVVAHALEAKALIPMLGLKTFAKAGAYPQYAGESGLRLIVSGIGRSAVANAVRTLADLQGRDDGQLRGWLNLGIAGHREAALGSGWLVNKITDQASGTRAYPPQLISGIAACSVVTVDAPECAYPQDALYEMEGSAYYEEASRHSTAELVQLFKIVSDNLRNPISQLDLKQVPMWIAQRQEQIEALVQGLSELVKGYNASHVIPAAYQEACAQLHLTVSQKLLLKRLCQRYRALGREAELDGAVGSAAGSSKRLLALLASQIDNPMSSG